MLLDKDCGNIKVSEITLSYQSVSIFKGFNKEMWGGKNKWKTK